MTDDIKIYYHLPGLFEFYDFYKVFLPLFYEHREFFYDWCEIGSVYGAPGDAIWGGGRVGFGDASPKAVATLMGEYGISSRLTFSNSFLTAEHLKDKECNALCALFEHNGAQKNGIMQKLLLTWSQCTTALSPSWKGKGPVRDESVRCARKERWNHG